MVKEIVSKTSDFAGDGITIATILEASIDREGPKNVAAEINSIYIKHGIDKTVEAAVAELAKTYKMLTEMKFTKLRQSLRIGMQKSVAS
jgi:chaperonin GroEL